MNEECYLDAAPAMDRVNDAAPFPMAYTQCQMALSSRARPPDWGRRNPPAGSGTPEPLELHQKCWIYSHPI
jgi:hypothetical protein